MRSLATSPAFLSIETDMHPAPASAADGVIRAAGRLTTDCKVLRARHHPYRAGFRAHFVDFDPRPAGPAGGGDADGEGRGRTRGSELPSQVLIQEYGGKFRPLTVLTTLIGQFGVTTSRTPRSGRTVINIVGLGAAFAPGSKRNRASRVARMICACIIAKFAPTQIRGPAPKGM